MKVFVSGYYGFGNLGDEALLAGLLSGLPGVQVTVSSGQPEATQTLHNVGAVHRLSGLGALITHDALLSGGGGLLQDKTSSRSLRYYLGVISLAKRLGKRVVVYGQSVGPLSPAGERAVARALKNVPVAVRDKPSQTLLARLDISAELVADAALALPAPLAPSAEDAPVLFVPRGGFRSVTAAFAALAQRLEAEGVPLAGLALQPNEDDRPLDELVRAAPSLQKFTVGTPGEALETVARSRYVVSARLHGLIFAARAGRAASGVAYDPKVTAFCDEAGLPVHLLRVDVDALYKEVFEVKVDQARVQKVVARAQNGLTWLRKTLEQ